MKRILSTLLVIFQLTVGSVCIYAQGTPGTVRFPPELDTPDSLLRAADNAASQLSTAITNVSTSITLLDASRFPQTGLAVIEAEKITWSSKSGNTLNGVTRGALGTLAVSHASSAPVRMVIAADYHNTLSSALMATQAKLGKRASTPPAPGANVAVPLMAVAAGESEYVPLSSLHVTTALGYTPLRPSLNLSDLSNAGTARTNLGLGALAVQNTVTSTQVSDWNAAVDARIPVQSVFGRTGAVTAQANDYTWAQINKTTSSLADLTTRSAADLNSGTLPDARFPATLPAVSGVNLTNITETSFSFSDVTTGNANPTRHGLLPKPPNDSTLCLRGDLQWLACVAASSTFLAADGSAANPAFSFANEPTTGSYRAGAGDYRVSILGTDTFRITTGAIGVGPNSLTFGVLIGSPDTFVRRDAAANALALANGANAQRFSVYGTTDGTSTVAPTNYSRLSVTGNQIKTETAGTGATSAPYRITASAPVLDLSQDWNNSGVTFSLIKANAVDTASASGSLLFQLQVGGSNKLTVGKDGAVIAQASIQSQANVVGLTGVYVSGTNRIGSQTLGTIAFQSDGVLRLADNAQTGFDRLQFGGTTSSFPALQRNGAALQSRLANDGGFANFYANDIGVGTSTVNLIASGRALTVSDSTLASVEIQRTPAGAAAGSLGTLSYWNGSVRVAQLIANVDAAGTGGGDLCLSTRPNGGNLVCNLYVGPNGNVVAGAQSVLATTATDGFFHIRTSAGPPTGVPTTFTGHAILHWDSSNHRLYAYDGTWRFIQF